MDFFLFPAKSRAIAIPVDLDSQVNNLFVKSNNVVQKSILNWRLSAKNTSRRDSCLSTSKDYRNIIERLQVCGPNLHVSEAKCNLFCSLIGQKDLNLQGLGGCSCSTHRETATLINKK